VKRLLFVDDEKYQAENYYEDLRDAGFSVQRAQTVADAEAAARNQVFDALVLDVMMDPGHLGDVSTDGGYLTGIELARRLGELGQTVPILFLTNSSDPRIDRWSALHPHTTVVRKAHVPSAEFPAVVEAVLRDMAKGSIGAVDSVVFVHGLGGTARRTWGGFATLIREDRDLCEVRCHWFDYPTALFRVPGGKRLPRIQVLVDGLRTFLNHSVDGGNVTLVCHSLGGLVGRSLVLDEVMAGRRLRVKRLLLYAVPNNGASLAGVARYVTCWNPHVRQLARDSDLIERLNQNWQRCRVSERVAVRFVVAGQDKVVSEESARMMWGNQVEVVLDQGHRSVVKPRRPEDLAFRIFKRFVSTRN